MAIRISELPPSPIVSNLDLLEISKSLGGSSYASQKINFSAIKESLVGKRTINVSTNTGADANTIKDGIALAAAMSPSFTNPVVVLVGAGIYYEVNPLIIPDNVSVVGVGGVNATMVGFTIPNANGFTLGVKTVLQNFSLYAPVPNVTAVKYIGDFSEAKDITIIGCETGFFISVETGEETGDCIAENCSIILVDGMPGSVCGTGFMVSNGAFLTMYNCTIWGLLGNQIGEGISVSGEATGVDVYSTSIYACGYGFKQIDNGYSYIENVSFGNCDNTISISGGKVVASGVQITDSNIKDIIIDDPSVILRLLGTADSSKFDIVSGADFSAQIQDLNLLSSGSRIVGKTISEDRMVVGYPDATNENPAILFDVGEGQSYDVDKYGANIVELWQYDATAPSGSRFSRFINDAGSQLTSNNSSIVVGGKFQFSSLRVDVAVEANVGSNSIVAEYWDGSGWIPISMAVYGYVGFNHRVNKPFQNRERQFVEHSTSIYDGAWYSDNDVLDEIPPWVSSLDMFAVRYRNNGNLVSGMTFENGLVKGDNYQISANTSRRITAWGKNRLDQTETLYASQYLPHTVNPADPYLVDISPNIKSTVPNCKLTQFFKKAFCDLHYIQNYVDTSTPLNLQLDVVPLDSDSTLGNIHIKVYVVVLARGQVLSGSATEMAYDVVIPTYNAPNVILAGFIPMDLSAYPPGTALALTVERDSTGSDYLDTYMGSVAVPLMIYHHTKKVI